MSIMVLDYRGDPIGRLSWPAPALAKVIEVPIVNRLGGDDLPDTVTLRVLSATQVVATSEADADALRHSPLFRR